MPLFNWYVGPNIGGSSHYLTCIGPNVGGSIQYLACVRHDIWGYSHLSGVLDPIFKGAAII